MLHTYTYVGSSIIYTCTDGEIDTELKGVLSANEIYNITMAVTTPDIRKKIALQTMTNKYDMILEVQILL